MNSASVWISSERCVTPNTWDDRFYCFGFTRNLCAFLWLHHLIQFTHYSAILNQTRKAFAFSTSSSDTWNATESKLLTTSHECLVFRWFECLYFTLNSLASFSWLFLQASTNSIRLEQHQQVLLQYESKVGEFSTENGKISWKRFKNRRTWMRRSRWNEEMKFPFMSNINLLPLIKIRSLAAIKSFGFGPFWVGLEQLLIFRVIAHLIPINCRPNSQLNQQKANAAPTRRLWNLFRGRLNAKLNQTRDNR